MRFLNRPFLLKSSREQSNRTDAEVRGQRDLLDTLREARRTIQENRRVRASLALLLQECSELRAERLELEEKIRKLEAKLADCKHSRGGGGLT
jgi:uncharacterized coiled-coil DUF342 family protein